ncbi:helix-turn-helix domain-containing protein [Actinomadura sp. B10D3]|uniref:TetR/AcrR family transcriptional regulator n=1 Tax=Actinomadura sp. B10D3 TaxID=3153557 RepID=UPI00325DD80D
MEGNDQDRLIETATRIFAELGYDGASLRMIADATGCDIGSVHQVAATKADLYRQVMQRVHTAEDQAMQDAVARFTSDRQGIKLLADAFLAFYADHPQALALWQHGWMGDAADVAGVDVLYVQPRSAQIADKIRDRVPPDVDPDYLVWSVMWCVYGFLNTGTVHTSQRPSSAPRRTDIHGFQAFLHAMIDRLFAPPQP